MVQKEAVEEMEEWAVQEDPETEGQVRLVLLEEREVLEDL